MAAIDLNRALATATERRLQWRARDAILYAHGIGLASDPLDETELAYVHDSEPLVFPTFPVSMALRGGAIGALGLDMRRMLHGEHAITLHRSIPAAGTAIARSKMLGIWDKGAAKGAVFVEEKQITLEPAGEPLATVIVTVFGRSEGGLGDRGEGRPTPHIVPSRVPDARVEISTAPNQALIYRLSGDLNPIHADPAAAALAGFERPILHGLCTFAICGRAVIDRFGARRAGRLRHIQARFSAPVFPGDALSIALWQDGEIVSFEASVPARDATVIKAGKAILAAEERP